MKKLIIEAIVTKKGAKIFENRFLKESKIWYSQVSIKQIGPNKRVGWKMEKNRAK